MKMRGGSSRSKDPTIISRIPRNRDVGGSLDSEEAGEGVPFGTFFLQRVARRGGARGIGKHRQLDSAHKGRGEAGSERKKPKSPTSNRKLDRDRGGQFEAFVLAPERNLCKSSSNIGPRAI